jgi:DNA-directed RNA polymerase subunit M/transcription elongation factor TFIIS
MHTGPMSESEGRFVDEAEKSERPCEKCGASEVYGVTWESNCGGYLDVKFECKACGHVYWIDGPDA